MKLESVEIYRIQQQALSVANSTDSEDWDLRFHTDLYEALCVDPDSHLEETGVVLEWESHPWIAELKRCFLAELGISLENWLEWTRPTIAGKSQLSPALWTMYLITGASIIASTKVPSLAA